MVTEKPSIQKVSSTLRLTRKAKLNQNQSELTSPRRFVVVEQDFTGMSSAKITELAIQMVKEADEEGAVVIPVLKGTLPAEGKPHRNRHSKNPQLQAKKRCLFTQLFCSKKPLFQTKLCVPFLKADLRTLKPKRSSISCRFLQNGTAKKKLKKSQIAALSLIEPLTRKQDEKVKQTIEELAK